MGSIRAHIFGRHKKGDREEVKLRLFDLDGTLIDLASGGGGHQKVEGVLTNDDIKGIPNMPFVLLPPTETDLGYSTRPTQLPIVMGGFGILEMTEPYTTESFDPDDPNDLFIVIGTDWSITSSAAMDIDPTGYLRANARNLFSRAGSSIQMISFSPAYHLTTQSLDCEDNGLGLIIANRGAASSLGGGHPNNKLKLTIWYEMIKTIDS